MMDEFTQLSYSLRCLLIIPVQDCMVRHTSEGFEMINHLIIKYLDSVIVSKLDANQVPILRHVVAFFQNYFQQGKILGMMRNYPSTQYAYSYNGEQIVLYSPYTTYFFNFNALSTFFSKEIERYTKNCFIETSSSERTEKKEAIKEGFAQLTNQIIDFLNALQNFIIQIRQLGYIFKEVHYLIPIHKIWSLIPQSDKQSIIRNLAQNTEWKKEFEHHYGKEWDCDQYFAEKDWTNQPEIFINSKYFSFEFIFRLLSLLDENDPHIEAQIFIDQTQETDANALQKLLPQVKERSNCTYLDLRQSKDHLKNGLNFQHPFMINFKEIFSLLIALNKSDSTWFIRVSDDQFDEMNFGLHSIMPERAEFCPIILKIPPISRSSSDLSRFQLNHEFLLCVLSDKNQPSLYPLPKVFQKSYTDAQGIFELRGLRNRNPRFHKQNRPNLWYPIYIDPNVESKEAFHPVSLESSARFSASRYPYNSQGKESVWRWGKTKSQQNLNSSDVNLSNLVAKRTRNGEWRVFEKNRKLEQKTRSLWYEANNIVNPTEDLTEQNNQLPIVEKALLIGSDPVRDTLILDPYATTASTFQATLKLNNLQQSCRSCILFYPQAIDSDTVQNQIKNALYGLQKEIERNTHDKLLSSQSDSEMNAQDLAKEDQSKNEEENQIEPDDFPSQEEQDIDEDKHDKSLKFPIVRVACFEYDLALLEGNTQFIRNIDIYRTEPKIDLNKLFQLLMERIFPLSAFENQFYKSYNLIESFNYLLGLTQIRRKYIIYKRKPNASEDPKTLYFLIHGSSVKGSYLILWRDASKFTFNDFQNEAKWLTQEIFLQYPAQHIFINAHHTVPHVESIEVIFMKLLSGIHNS